MNGDLGQVVLLAFLAGGVFLIVRALIRAGTKK